MPNKQTFHKNPLSILQRHAIIRLIGIKDWDKLYKKPFSLLNFGKGGLVVQGVIFRIRGIPVQTTLGVWPGFRTQPCYEAPDIHILQGELSKTH